MRLTINKSTSMIMMLFAILLTVFGFIGISYGGVLDKGIETIGEIGPGIQSVTGKAYRVRFGDSDLLDTFYFETDNSFHMKSLDESDDYEGLNTVGTYDDLGTFFTAQIIVKDDPLDFERHWLMGIDYGAGIIGFGMSFYATGFGGDVFWGVPETETDL